MKNKYIILTACLFLMTVGSFFYACSDKGVETETVEMASTRSESPSSVNKYYSIIPGTTEWNSIKTGKGLWDICQLSDDVLQGLTTDELIEACMEFPLAYDYLFSNKERFAISFFVKNFSVLKELQNRSDGVTSLIEYYKDFRIGKDAYYQHGVYRYPPFSLGYIELILVDSQMLDLMSADDYGALQKIARDKLDELLKSAESYGQMNIKRLLVVLSEIELRANLSLGVEDTESLRNYAENYQRMGTEDLEKIMSLLYK